MICLIAGTAKDADKWARGQNLRAEEWFYGATLFHIYGKKNFHTIIVPENIDLLSNNELNRLLTAAWECGRKR